MPGRVLLKVFYGFDDFDRSPTFIMAYSVKWVYRSQYADSFPSYQYYTSAFSSFFLLCYLPPQSMQRLDALRCIGLSKLTYNCIFISDYYLVSRNLLAFQKNSCCHNLNLSNFTNYFWLDKEFLVECTSTSIVYIEGLSRPFCMFKEICVATSFHGSLRNGSE